MSSSSGSENQPTVLLVEDNPGDARLFEEAFSEVSSTGEVLVVSTGEDALDFVCKRNEYTDVPQPDLIFLDWHLPATTGEELVGELKNDKEFRHIPVIVLTGSQADHEIITAYKNHATACLRKSSDPDELIDTLQAFKEFWLETDQLPRTDAVQSESELCE